MEADSLSPEERLFAEFRDRRSSGELIEIDRFCDQHPAQAAELHRLWANWRSMKFSKVVERPLERGRTSEDDWKQQLLRIASGDRDSERYEVEGELARGGMGAILRVRDSHLRRTLAMKKILSDYHGETGVDETDAWKTTAPATLGRFMEEAQVTAQIDHPGVVPVHELGVDSKGHVFFTMKLVNGRDLREIFELVRSGKEGWHQTRALNVLHRACEAVAFAHAKGVIHRDLKPANIMVGRFGETYVMDWGLARVLGRDDRHDLRIRQPATRRIRTLRSERLKDRADTPLETMDGMVLGTPAFMPPEQALGQIDRIGPQSDVYAMGAILYQLLTGILPFADGPKPLTPASILSMVQSRPPTNVTSLAPRAAPELVAICEQAMARDISRRYPDMSALADDLRSFLENRVVSAHRTGAWIELRKWVTRNRPLAASLAAILVLCGLASTGYAWLSGEAAKELRLERDRTLEQAQALAVQQKITQAVSDFQTEMLTIDAWEEGKDVRALDLVRRAARGIETTDAGEPEVELGIRSAIARTFVSLGDSEGALPHQVRVWELEAELTGPESPSVLSSRVDVVRSQLALNRLDEAGRRLEELVPACVQVLGPAHRDTIRARISRGELLFLQGNLEQAETEVRDALQAAGGAPLADTVELRSLAGHILSERGKLAEAERHYRDVVQYRRENSGPEGWGTAMALSSLGTCLAHQGRHGEAGPMLRKALETKRERLGDAHDATLTTMANYAQSLGFSGELDQAARLQEEVLEHRREQLPDTHPEVLKARLNLGATLSHLERFQEALDLFEAARASLGQSLPPFHMIRLGLTKSIGEIRRRTGSVEDAIQIYREVLDQLISNYEESHPWVADTHEDLGLALSATGQREEAESEFRKAWDLRTRHLGPSDQKTVSARLHLAEELAHLDELEAENQFLGAIENALGPQVQAARQKLIEFYEESGRGEDAAHQRMLLKAIAPR